MGIGLRTGRARRAPRGIAVSPVRKTLASAVNSKRRTRRGGGGPVRRRGRKAR